MTSSTVDVRDRIIGPLASVDSAGTAVSVDFADLVAKLVLSEQYVLDSHRLQEFPLLVRKFGYDGVQELLQSELIRIHCEPTHIAWVGSTSPAATAIIAGRAPLGLCEYDFQVVLSADRKDYIHRCLMPLNDIPGLKGKQGQRLRKAVAGKLGDTPANAGGLMLSQFQADLDGNIPLLKRSLALEVERRVGVSLSGSEFALQIHRLSASEVRVETNLDEILGLDAQTAHETIGHGLLGVGGLNERIELMDRYAALAGFRTDDLPLFEGKLALLARQFDPDAARESFERIVSVAGLPTVESDTDTRDVDLSRLIEIVQGDEVQAFRRWLRETDELTETEIENRISPLRDRLALAVHSTPGQVVRFATAAGAGFIPGVGAIAGMAVGALDQFLVNTVIRRPGPTAFVSQLYKSIFPDR